MSGLKISKDLTLPRDTVTSTIVVYGGKGMGKTVFGAVLAEELAAAGLRWAWLDPLGVAWGIRHSADGNGPGVECLIMGGVHGDVPIEPTGGEAVADIVVEESVNVLIDISRKPSGEMWGVGERIRFVNAYARRLFQRQGDLIKGRRREPLFQILDEAARYVPQTIPAGNPDLAMCVGAWQQFVEEGRNVGLGVGLLTQRSARINKDVAELADVMVAFRTVGPNSLVAVMDWLGDHVEKSRAKDLAGQVRELPRGSALVVSPGWLGIEKVVAMRMRHTFDSSATPKPGERARTAKGAGAKPDLDQIRARMAATIERAKADDPKELKKRIAELERQAKQVPAAAPADGKPKVIEKPVITEKQLARIEKLAERVTVANAQSEERAFAMVQSGQERWREVAGAVKELAAAAKQAASAIPEKARSVPATPAIVPPKQAPAARARVSVPPSGEPFHIAPARQRILDSLAWYEAIGVSDPSRTQVAWGADTSSKSSAFDNNLSAMRTAGLIDYARGGLHLTDGGRPLASPPAAPGTNEELQAMVTEKLAPAQRRILKALIESYPAPLSKVDLAHRAETSAASSAFDNNLSFLRTFGVLDYPTRGLVVATKLLFPVQP